MPVHGGERLALRKNSRLSPEETIILRVLDIKWLVFTFYTFYFVSLCCFIWLSAFFFMLNADE